MARQDKGAGGANPMDWNRKVITYVGKEDGHIYDCTIAVIYDYSYMECIGGNIICVDLRNILPQFKNEEKRAGHAMFIDIDTLEIGRRE